ncbi:hypothetical protein MAHJHV57_51700 [Mycobacterium avium subsp. hominissuis]
MGQAHQADHRAAGAAMSDVITWIEAGHPADPSRYHTATRDGVATPSRVAVW